MSEGLSPLVSDWYRESRELSFDPLVGTERLSFVIIFVLSFHG
jgi:hypothetical protein